MDFYERLETLRKQRKISQRDLEIELGFSNGSISKWRKSSPTHDRLQKVADYFNVTIEYLITGEDNRAETPAFEKEHIELITLYSQLEKEQKDAVFNLLRSFCSK